METKEINRSLREKNDLRNNFFDQLMQMFNVSEVDFAESYAGKVDELFEELWSNENRQKTVNYLRIKNDLRVFYDNFLMQTFNISREEFFGNYFKKASELFEILWDKK